MPSTIRNLLDELSWEGQSASYRGGGAGGENVLTAEVWQALDALPREAFLGAVLTKAHLVSLTQRTDRQPQGPQCQVVAGMARGMECEVLCGDRGALGGEIRVQPDVLLQSSDAVVLVEAKRVKGGVFPREQLARNVLVLAELGGARAGMLLLVLGSAPPIRIRELGRVEIVEALDAGWASLRERGLRLPELGDVAVDVAWITWVEIAAVVSGASRRFTNGDPDVVEAVRRSAGQVASAVRFQTSA